MLSLPFDCLATILQKIDIVDVVTVCLCMGTKDSIEDLVRLIKYRRSPLRLFSGLVDNPHKLMYHMSVSDAVLCGSRAVDYMYPGSCRNNSTWDFIVSNDIPIDKVTSCGILSALVEMGAKWESDNASVCSDLALPVLKGVMTRGRGKGQKLQMICTPGVHPAVVVLGFSSTAVQCMVTHYAAVHFYGKLSRDRECMIWHKSVQQRQWALERFNTERCELYKNPEELTTRIHGLGFHGSWIQMVHKTMRKYLESNDRDGSPVVIEITKFREFLVRHHHWSGIANDTKGRIVNVLPAMVTQISPRCSCILDTTERTSGNYESRGYRILDSEEYRTRVLFDRRHQAIRLRKLRDSESAVISFKGYKTCTEDNVIDTHLGILSQLVWNEGWKGTMTCTVPSFH